MDNLAGVYEFLSIIADKGFINENTVGARRVACNKVFDLLDPEERNVKHVLANLDTLKLRFTNKYKDISGKTVEEYMRRIKLVLDDFTQWSDNRADWERRIAGKQTGKAGRDEERKPRAEKPSAASASVPTSESSDPAAPKVTTFPFPDGREVRLVLPVDGLSMAEIKRLSYYLLPYAKDWTPDVMPEAQRV